MDDVGAPPRLPVTSSVRAVSSRRLWLRATLPCVCGAGADLRELLARACLSCGMRIPLNGDTECCAGRCGGADALPSRASVAKLLLELSLDLLPPWFLSGLAIATAGGQEAML
jgi:hypothetical protein